MKIHFSLLLIVVSIFQGYAQTNWQEATRVADSLSTLYNSSDALMFREQAIALAKKEQPDTLNFLNVLKEITKTETFFKNPNTRKETFEALKEKIAKLETLNAKPDRMYPLYGRLYVYSYIYIGDLKITELYLKKSIDTHLKSDVIDSNQLISSMNDSGVISKQLGKLEYSLKIFNDALLYHKKMNVENTNILGRIYSELGDLYDGTHLNIPQKRVLNYKKAEAVYGTIKDAKIDEVIGISFRLSDFYRIEGDYEKALGYLNKGFNVYLKNKEEIQNETLVEWGVTRELQYYQFLTRIHSKLNDETKMLEAHDKVIFYGNSDKMDDRGYRWYAISYLDLADYYKRKGDNEKVRKNIQTGLELANAKVADFVPDFNLALAKLEIETGNFTIAEVILNNDVNFKRIIPSKEPILFKTKALLSVKMQNPILAIENINTLLNFIDAGDNNITIQNLIGKDYKPGYTINDAELLTSLAKELESDEKLQPYSKKLYWLALAHFHHNYLQGQLTKEQRGQYNSIIAGILNSNSTQTLTREEKKDFINKTEDIESRFLWSKFNQNRQLANNDITKELVEREQQVRANITFLKKKNLLENSEDLKQRIFEETLKLKEIETALLKENSVYASMVNPSFSVSELDVNGQSYIKFMVADGSLYRAVISEKEIIFKNLGDYKAISEDVLTYITSLRDLQEPIASLNTASSSLYKTLLEGAPLNSHTYILPQAVLNYLPFELLQKDKEYLINSHTISYAIGLSYLINNESLAPSKTENNVALFAPSYARFVPSETQLAVRGEAYDLSGAKAEVSEISKIISSQVYVDGAASKKAFQNLNKDVSIIHLSMHSFLNDRDPELSSLVFSDQDPENELYISELYGLNLNADLAVLSACNTGIGGFDEGDGVVSMSRAFTFAGVPATVSSLWSAPDLSTKEIMVSFYEHLKVGKTKSKALQLAKLDYLKNTSEDALKHPYYWAGFVLHGVDAPISLQGQTFFLIWILSGIILIGIVLLLAFRKRKIS